jgi:Transposase DDE domain
MRQRDPRFATADRHKERHREERRHERGTPTRFRPKDFAYDEANRTCVCPAGQPLYRNGSNVTVGGFTGVKCRAPKSACRPCALRAQCLRNPTTTEGRQVVFFTGRAPGTAISFTARMKARIDSALGKARYARRLALAEPPFANLRYAKRLDRFTLRGKQKVNGQWLLYCLVHNIEKMQRYGPLLTPSA